MPRPVILLVDPAHFEVAYSINPWMSPALWRSNGSALRQAAQDGFTNLKAALRRAGAVLEIVEGVAGAPDLVFPANAAVVLDGRAVLARFRHIERQVEEPVFRAAFNNFKERGLVDEVGEIPFGEFQEGAGDFIWDDRRKLFWAGYGPRSTFKGARAVADFFGEKTVMLELATERYYHLDTCFCPLPAGEVLYYPPAFTPSARRLIEDHVGPELLLEASDEDAERFCVNAVGMDRTIIMAKASDRLRALLTSHGYRLEEVDLAPFILSGGGAYCMTLRLDRQSHRAKTKELAMAEEA